MAIPKITIDERAQENGLAVMIADLMTQNMEQNPNKISSFRRLKSVVSFSAPDADVRLTIFFNKGSCVIFDGIVGKPALHIEADSDTIIQLSSLPTLQVGQLITNFGVRSFVEQLNWDMAQRLSQLYEPLFLLNPINPTGLDIAKKVMKGKVKVHGALKHPMTMHHLSNLLSVY
jgi:hypothetical protein